MGASKVSVNLLWLFDYYQKNSEQYPADDSQF